MSKSLALLSLIAILAVAGCASQGQFLDGEQAFGIQPAPSPKPATAAPQPYIYYPEKGQSPQQQEFDRGQCYSWAV